MTNIKILNNEDLTKFNTYHIHTKTKYMTLPNTKEELKECINYCKDNNISYFILGNGSNVILSDKPYNGMIINLLEMNSISIDEETGIVECQAGAMLPKVCNEAVSKNLKGLEWASGIPGTVGGAIYGNAGAYLACTYDYLLDVTVLYHNEFKVLKKEDLTYDYRTSFFKNNREYIIVSARFKLEKGIKEESLKLIQNRRERRLASQPLEYPSAGSVFRNPSKEQPAGMLIEQSSLKGRQIGDAQISEKHANFIINKGASTQKDIKELINIIKKEVKNNYNIDLICEQEIIDWD